MPFEMLVFVLSVALLDIKDGLVVNPRPLLNQFISYPTEVIDFYFDRRGSHEVMLQKYD